MKKQIGFLSVIAGTILGSFTSFGEVPVVSDVKMIQDQITRLVTITYNVKNSAGIVTLDIQTNGVSIGAENIQYLTGDVNKEVEVGAHTISWRPDKSWQGYKADQATAKVFIWNKNMPPDYMAIDLVDGSTSWYTSTNALPGGIGSDLYRKNILLMRRIYQPNGGTWLMGSPVSGEGWRDPKREALHNVTLAEDYWLGVFEVTQKQWELVTSKNPSIFKEGEWTTKPVENVSYNTIRGGDPQYHYPNNPDPNSFLGILREKTGINSFDLPSEMQWEYACRAGTETALNNGASLSQSEGQNDDLDMLGRYRDNGGQKVNEQGKWVTDLATARVGSFQPNAWGLYDMHGNVYEWCLDYFTENITQFNGGVNFTEGTDRIRRGGGWNCTVSNCRSALRRNSPPNTADGGLGFRLMCSQVF